MGIVDQRNAAFHRLDRAIAIDVERGLDRAGIGAFGRDVIVAQAGVHGEAALCIVCRNVRRVDIVAHVVAALAAVAPEGHAIGIEPVAGKDAVTRIDDVEQGSVVALHFQQVRGPDPVHVDGLPRLVVARGDRALIEAAGKLQVIGEAAEIIDFGIEQMRAHGQDAIRRLPGTRPACIDEAIGSGRPGELRADGIGHRLPARDLGRKRRDEAAVNARPAKAFLQFPSLAHVEYGFQPQRSDDRVHAVLDVGGIGPIVAVEAQVRGEIR